MRAPAHPSGPAARTSGPADQIDALTGLRGVAVVIVIMSHCANAGYLPPILGEGTGQIGVMLFFALSGFLMARLYLDRPADAATLHRFALARAGRVLPLFYLVVALSAAAGLVGLAWPYPVADLPSLVRHLALIRGGRELWAVPVEVQFYLIFVLIWVAAQGAGGGPIARLAPPVAVLGALFVVQVYLSHGPAAAPPTVFYFTPYFLLGLLMHAVEDPARRVVEGLSGATRHALAIVSVAMLVLSLPGLRRTLGLYVPEWIDPTVFAAVGIAFLCGRFGIGCYASLRHPALLWLGTISYGLYLLHPVVMLWVGQVAGPAPHGPLASAVIVAAILALSALVAALSLAMFERPLLRRLKALGGPSRRPA